MKLLLMTLLALAATLQTARADEPGRSPDTIQQLRIYEIFDHNKQAFHDRFRDHAARIMQRHGFHILGIWETRHDDRTEFVYLLEWPDRDTMTARWDAFMADEEWSDIKRRTGAVHGSLVGGIEDRVLEPTDYSPWPEAASSAAARTRATAPGEPSSSEP